MSGLNFQEAHRLASLEGQRGTDFPDELFEGGLLALQNDRLGAVPHVHKSRLQGRQDRRIPHPADVSETQALDVQGASPLRGELSKIGSIRL